MCLHASCCIGLTFFAILYTSTVQRAKVLLKDLHNLVSPHYSVAWKEIGEELNLPIRILNALQKDYPSSSETCCDKMLEELCNLNPGIHWGDILNVLDSPNVLAVINSFSHPKVLQQYNEAEMLDAVYKVADRLQDNSKANRYRSSRDDWPPFQPIHCTFY